MKIQTIASVVAIIMALSSSYVYIDNRYALAADLAQVSDRLEFKIVEDKLNSVQQRIWMLQDRYEERPTPKTVEEELRELQRHKEKLDLSYRALIERAVN